MHYEEIVHVKKLCASSEIFYCLHHRCIKTLQIQTFPLSYGIIAISYRENKTIVEYRRCVGLLHDVSFVTTSLYDATFERNALRRREIRIFHQIQGTSLQYKSQCAISLYISKMLRSFVSCFLLVGASFLVRPASLLDPRIVGGTPADIRQHPYQLSLQRTSHTCGAAVISNKWVVTAAHCVSLGGVYRLNAGSNDKYGGVYYRVKRVVRHPNYDSLTIDYDIALLEVDGEIRFNDRVQPVKLAEKELANGVTVNVTGWGAVTPGGGASPVLMKVSLPIVDRRTCRSKYMFTHVITDRMICAGDLRRGGKDSCQGDSGGPLTADGTLYGIVSWGYECARPDYPGVYTNVADLRWWIKWISGV